MIINNSNISLNQHHEKLTHSEEYETMNLWISDRQNNNPQIQNLPRSEPADLSLNSTHAPHKESQDLTEISLSPKDELRVLILKQMIEAITGEKFELFDPASLHQDMSEIELDANIQEGTPPANQSSGFGIEYDYYASHYEYEALSFSAQGSIKTQDGKSITFSAQLNVQREFFEQQSISFRAGDAVKIDPLVLNFNGRAAQLQETRFEFDLDADGRSEQIALLSPDNAYLALDRNNDGQVNNGSELFGPSTGQGFNELAQYDDDGNQFIDEADNIYEHLRLWFRDANGQEQLIALGDKDVGAIYLGHINTPFELQQNQQSLGDIASSSIYLNENGTTGFIQQIDLRV